MLFNSSRPSSLPANTYSYYHYRRCPVIRRGLSTYRLHVIRRSFISSPSKGWSPSRWSHLPLNLSLTDIGTRKETNPPIRIWRVALRISPPTTSAHTYSCYHHRRCSRTRQGLHHIVFPVIPFFVFQAISRRSPPTVSLLRRTCDYGSPDGCERRCSFVGRHPYLAFLLLDFRRSLGLPSFFFF